METKFNFKSQICTDKNQSERLLALGLKKETADMCWQTTTLNGEPITYPSQDVWMNGSIITNNHFPAWSLHRLIEMIQDAIVNKDGNDDNLMLDISGIGLYDGTIDAIAELIKEGCFSKEYLV